MAIAALAGCGHARGLAPFSLRAIDSLGADSGAAAIANLASISARSGRGYRVVMPASGSGTVAPLLFADGNRFLRILRAGADTDQQFERPLFARIGPDDSIWVFDDAPRALVFSPEGNFVRAFRLPASPWDALVLPGSRVVIAPAHADRPLPLLLLRTDRPGAEEFETTDGAAIAAPRWLALDPDGTLWSMPVQFRWRIEHWDTMGRSLGTAERRTPWFEPYGKLIPPSVLQPPQPEVRGFWVDASHNIWIVGRVSDRRWARGLAADRAGVRGRVISDADRVFDSAIEVYDPVSRSTLAAATMDRVYPWMAEPGAIARISDRPSGWKLVELVRVTLMRAKTERPGP